MHNKTGRRFAVVVGVSRYLHGYRSLRFAGADALKVASALQASGYQVQTLATDTEVGSVRRQAVLDAFTEVAQEAKPDDHFLFYFSGHGSRQNGRDYLLLSDADPRRFDATALSLDALGAVLERCKAQQRLFIVDACRDPGLSSVAQKGGTLTGFTKGGLPKGFAERVGKAAQQSPPRQPARWAALFACSPNQLSRESDEESSGVFTTRFLAALSGGIGGTVTVQAALRYVLGSMPQPLRELQKPDALGDVNLAIAESTPNLLLTKGNGFVATPFALHVRFMLSGLVASHIRTEYLGGGGGPAGNLKRNFLYDVSNLQPEPLRLRARLESKQQHLVLGEVWDEADDMIDVMRSRKGPAEWLYCVPVFRGERSIDWYKDTRWRLSIFSRANPNVPALVREVTCDSNIMGHFNALGQTEIPN